MHDEVYEATQDTGSYPRDSTASAASSPSEAYANLTLEARESMAADAENNPRTAASADQPPSKPPPRSSSPAKRLHSDMDDAGRDPMDVQPSSARRNSGQSSPRTTKPLPTASQRSTRATSVDMLDGPANSVSAASSDTASTSNPESAATSISAERTPPHAAEVPSLDEQVGKVLMIHNRKLKDSQEGYVISEKWLERVFARTSENKNNPEQFDKAATEGEIGPVDNSDLVTPDALTEDLEDQNGDDFIPLRPGLTMGHDFEILPVEAWELILSWYGLKEGTPVIRRYVHNTALDKDLSENLQYEVYPPIFTIRKVRKSAQNAQEAAKPGPRLIASRGDGVVNFLRTAKKAVGIDAKSKTKFWRVLNTAPTETAPSQPSGMLTPDSSPRNASPVSSTRNAVPMIIDSASFNALVDGTERELFMSKDETTNEKYNGSQTLALIGLAEDQVLILEEQDEKGDFPSDSSKKTSQKNGLQLSKVNKGLQSGATSGRNSPAPSDRVTRGRTTRTGKTRGTVGLTNLGNTCYMNSALQCIRSVEELSAYFSAEKWKEDLNADNPLGHGGQIAKAYCGLLTQIYGEGTISAFAPKNFKAALGRAQPLFSGYGQQDSQEFLSFLVDGLHEDLNRVKKKPYTENPESDDNTVHDPEAIKALGEKYREIHRSRNNSVAMDLFNGFYKNTMVCPDCDKVSITFDPYSLLTLQLPIEQTWQHTVTFVPLRGSIINVEIDIDKNATIKQLKEYIAKRFPGVKASRLMGAEVYTHKFYRVLENNKSVSECNIGQRDVIYFYELDNIPTNWPPPKKKQQYRSMLYPMASSEEDIPKSASPLGDKMLVPIFHRAPNMSTYRGNAWSLVLWPSYIVLTREEAKDYDEIMRKVLGRVAQMTTRPILSELDETPQDQSRSGSDIVLTTEEDAYPNGDPRVQDGSVEGEDNMVEVTMTDAGETAPEGDAKEQVPDILKPGAFINPAFRNLFEIKHTKAGKEMVPTGWSSIDSNKPYEPISKRVRTVESRQSSVQSTEGEANSNASSSDADDVPQFSADANSSIDVANESSDEDVPAMPSVESEPFSRGGRANSKKNKRKNKKHQKHNKGFNTYSKKGKDRFNSQPPQSFSEPESDDEEGLIRLGEGLVLEWNQESYDALFDGSVSQNGYYDRGVDTSKDIPTYDDPELREKKAKRIARKKNGITLEECFQETSKSEVLSEDNAWYCNRCKELRRATKTLEIWTAPEILVVHLKRFSAHRTFRDKIEAFVDCPLEGLDLSGKVGLPEDKSLVYDLFAVDNHYGGLGGGHYTASARNFFDGKWYDYNDSIVSPKNPASVVTSNAYLLFYRRRQDAPLGPEYLQNLTNHFRNPDYEDRPDDDSGNDSASRNASPSGNGSRLGDLSRNGSSSAFGAGAGAGVLRGGGSTLAGNLLLKGAGAGQDTEMSEELPEYTDEGYADDEDFHGIGESADISALYNPLYQNASTWRFGPDVPRNGEGVDDDEVYDEDAASDMPNLGSNGGGDLNDRILEDFGDELGAPGAHPGTPEEVLATLGGEGGDGDVANVLLDDEVPTGMVGQQHVKVD